MKREIEIKLSIKEIAEAFCDLNDEDQAQFFVEAARIGASWEPTANVFQWFSVGKHLRTWG